ncbi:MAG TPA: glycosyltransferase family 4 protein [Candidatus Saccharimonadales bacterium]|nr:glycosyltransferase family 4 protein [Candidatus Saccharimonadales bacterium]
MKHNPHRPLRLVFFSFGILEQGGGFENYLLTTARGLADRYKDLSITMVTMAPEIVEKLQHVLSVYFMRVQKPRAIYRESRESVLKKLGGIPYRQAASLKDLALLLRDCDVIYSKNEVLELGVLNRIGLHKLPPVMLGVHTPIFYPNAPSLSAHLHNFLYTGPLYRWSIRRIRAIEVNNSDDLLLVRRKLRFENVKLVRQAFEIPALSAKWPAGGKLHVLFVGRLTEAKGIDLLVAVIETLERQHPGSFVVKIAGSGDEAFVRAVRRLAQRVPAVEYLGHVENSKVAALYDWADAAVITSNYETLNKVAIEAAIAGKIAVCTDIPGPREIIRDGITGFLLPREPQAFASRLAELARLKHTDPKALKAIGRAAHKHVKQTFDATAVYRELHADILTLAGR